MTILRFRIIISTYFIIILIIAGSYLVIQDVQTGIIERDFRDKGFLLANHLSLEVSSPLRINNLVEARRYIEDMKNSYPDIEYIFLTDPEGNVLMQTFDGDFPQLLKNTTRPSNTGNENQDGRDDERT